MIPPERYASRISVQADGCWIWTGARNNTGYGFVWLVSGKKRTGAHRAVYEAVRGAIPAGLELDHLCRVSACVNPDHLEPVSHRENIYRSPYMMRNRTHCRHGHELTPDNLYVLGKRRWCLACRQNDRIRAEQRRVAADA